MVGSGSIQAQILKNVTGTVKDAGNTVTNPVKDARNTVRDITDIPNDIRNAKRDVTRPAEDLKREVDGLKNDVNNAKRDVDGLGGNRKGTKEEQAKQDSLDAADKEAKRLAYEAEKARRDSVYKSKLRTGTVIVEDDSDGGSTEVLTSDPSRTVLLPPSTIPSKRPSAYPPRTRNYTRTSTSTQGGVNANTTAGGNSGSSAASGSSASGGTRTRTGTVTTNSASSGDSPMSSRSLKYNDTPAKRYLERSDFDEETLEDLFEAAIWTGPDSVHTARSIEYMLQQYRLDLDEVKRIDPNFDIDGREDRYRKWSGLFYRNTRPMKED